MNSREQEFSEWKKGNLTQCTIVQCAIVHCAWPMQFMRSKQTNKQMHQWSYDGLYPRPKTSLLELKCSLRCGCTWEAMLSCCGRSKRRLIPHGRPRFAILFRLQPRLFASSYCSQPALHVAWHASSWMGCRLSRMLSNAGLFLHFITSLNHLMTWMWWMWK